VLNGRRVMIGSASCCWRANKHPHFSATALTLQYFCHQGKYAPTKLVLYLWGAL
jgi:hypothetical protein